MKLKYYLRGLGIGVLVTAAIMSFSNKNAKAEIIKEYEQKLQIASGEEYLSEEELTSEAFADENQSYVPEGNRDEEKEAEIDMAIESALEQEKADDYEGQQTAADSNAQIQSEVQGEATQPAGEQTAQVRIEVEPGDSAGNVAYKLQEAGVIDNMDEFIVFMQQNGYDKKIRTGPKKINLNDDWDSIGKKLTIKDYDGTQNNTVAE